MLMLPIVTGLATRVSRRVRTLTDMVPVAMPAGNASPSNASCPPPAFTRTIVVNSVLISDRPIHEREHRRARLIDRRPARAAAHLEVRNPGEVRRIERVP